jgi:nitrate reductase delta subunit
MSDAILYGRLAVLFSYPADGYGLNAADALGASDSVSVEAAAVFREFRAGIAGLSTEELQELFTRTFDLNPMCTLEIGWQLYGEDYQRGEFLVKMRQQLREYDLAESGELPDHLSHALMLLGKLDAEDAAEFASCYLLPALDKMRAGWRQNRNAFAALLDTAFLQLQSQYPYDPTRMPLRKPELPILQ